MSSFSSFLCLNIQAPAPVCISVQLITSCAGGRHNMPRPFKLTFDLLTLKVVSESRVTWTTSVPILVFLGISATVFWDMMCHSYMAGVVDVVYREINGLCLCIKMGSIQTGESCTDVTHSSTAGFSSAHSSPAHGYLHRYVNRVPTSSSTHSSPAHGYLHRYVNQDWCRSGQARSRTFRKSEQSEKRRGTLLLLVKMFIAHDSPPNW